MRLERVYPVLKVAATPSETVEKDRRSGFKLVHYSSRVAPGGLPVLLVPHMINRFYILDFATDVSVVRQLLEKGLDVHLIDWGYPALEQRDLSFSDYVSYVRHCMGTVSEGKVSLLGYCTGGIISLMLASLEPDMVSRLVLLATPVDFSASDDLRLLVGKMFNARAAVSLSGIVPGEIINSVGSFLLAIFMPLFLADPEFVQELTAYESWRDVWRRLRWIGDAQPVPGNAWIEFIEGCYQENRLVNGRFMVNGKYVRLDEIRCPVMNTLAKFDHLVPVEAGRALGRLYKGRWYEETIFPSSHVGLSVSLRAHRDLWPRVADWLKQDVPA